MSKSQARSTIKMAFTLTATPGAYPHGAANVPNDWKVKVLNWSPLLLHDARSQSSRACGSSAMSESRWQRSSTIMIISMVLIQLWLLKYDSKPQNNKGNRPLSLPQPKAADRNRSSRAGHGTRRKRQIAIRPGSHQTPPQTWKRCLRTCSWHLASVGKAKVKLLKLGIVAWDTNSPYPRRKNRADTAWTGHGTNLHLRHLAGFGLLGCCRRGGCCRAPEGVQKDVGIRGLRPSRNFDSKGLGSA